MRMRFLIISALLLITSCDRSQPATEDPKQTAVEVSNQSLDRVEPPHWWTGFKSDSLQLLVHHEGIGNFYPTIDYPGVSISGYHKAKSVNYLFVDLIMDNDTEPGKFDILFTSGTKESPGDSIRKHTYELRSREKASEKFEGFDTSDVIYLITPDRFANGNPDNDVNTDLMEKTINRSQDYARHGGDIKGITDNLDYIESMGFTAVWSSPLLTNDMPRWSYHGYAITDYYEVDPRFGTLEDYLELAGKAKEKGIKLIMDQVANHCGKYHWWMSDLPFDDWLNYQDRFENGEQTIYSSHRRTANQDIYASEVDKKALSDGWFVDDMPDLNQRNPFMARYIIQNSIWWIETLELGGIRQDTYPYPDKAFMSDWAGAIMDEYPNFNIVGEEWSYNPLLINYWQDGTENKDGYDSNLPTSMDFAMQEMISEAVSEDENWNSGLIKIYDGLANDFHYTDPMRLMVFPSNHDMDRLFTQVGEDAVAHKMALATHLLLPRIPQLYYGVEILMENSAKPGDHGLIRTDFPGGWEDDEVNAFVSDGLSQDQLETQEWLKALLNFRKDSKAIHKGKTVHFAPKDGVYTLFRMYEDEVVVMILNKNDNYELDLSRFDELNLNGRAFENSISGQPLRWGESLTLDEKGVLILNSK